MAVRGDAPNLFSAGTAVVLEDPYIGVLLWLRCGCCPPLARLGHRFPEAQTTVYTAGETPAGRTPTYPGARDCMLATPAVGELGS
jgi:hypothetical protein